MDSGIDHVVVAVRDLEAAQRQYRRLGFQPTPRGNHGSLGSINHCVMFAGGNYLELLALARPDAPRPYYREFLIYREGLAAVALKTADAEATRARLQAAGLRPTDVVRFGRPVAMPGGSREARFATTDAPLEATPGGRLFFCQHFTPELVWLPEYLPHPNGAEAVLSVDILAADPAAAAAAYAKVLGIAAVPAADGLLLSMPGGTIRLMSPAAFKARHAEDPLADLSPPAMVAIRLRVADRDHVANLLRQTGVQFRVLADGAIALASTDAVGTVLELG